MDVLVLGAVAWNPLQAAQRGGGLSGGSWEERVPKAGSLLVHPHVFLEDRSTHVTSQGETVIENPEKDRGGWERGCCGLGPQGCHLCMNCLGDS